MRIKLIEIPHIFYSVESKSPEEAISKLNVDRLIDLIECYRVSNIEWDNYKKIPIPEKDSILNKIRAMFYIIEHDRYSRSASLNVYLGMKVHAYCYYGKKIKDGKIYRLQVELSDYESHVMLHNYGRNRNNIDDNLK